MREKVTIDERGGIIIPAPMRDAAGLKANDELIIEETADGLLLRSVDDVAIEIYTEERIREFARDEDALDSVLPDLKQS